MWRTKVSGFLGRLPGLQPDGSSKITAYPSRLEKWRRLTPSQRRKALILGCWAAICWRLVERGHAHMALHVLLGLTACSRPSTLLATRRCDLVKLARGGSLLFPLLGTATASPRRSQAQQKPSIRRGLPPGLPAPEQTGRTVSGNVGCAITRK